MKSTCPGTSTLGSSPITCAISVVDDIRSWLLERFVDFCCKQKNLYYKVQMSLMPFLLLIDVVEKSLCSLKEMTGYIQWEFSETEYLPLKRINRVRLSYLKRKKHEIKCFFMAN
ncbi:hypothetical protein DP116_09210 [Brasilonema bromeliae SPC951]|uniref:Uncharacterized protein n=1 Tax=Brasilonema bromeliae SPC951 TaxID=385972 RepID=A0ABX1P5J1_9CYAN|nr:hypothetical protein [Brasilonema bromeliae SPC951]